MRNIALNMLVFNRKMRSFQSAKRPIGQRAIILTLFVILFVFLACKIEDYNVSAIGKTTSEIGIIDKISIMIKSDMSVVYNGEEINLKDASGNILYPIIYKDNLYLPVRGVSNVVGKEIEWEKARNVMYVGKTPSGPNNVKKNESILIPRKEKIESIEKPVPYMAGAYIRPNFVVMVDFIAKEFYDNTGARIYPIVLNGYTYLPTQDVGNLFGVNINLNSLRKTIFMASKSNLDWEQDNSYVAVFLGNQFDKQVQIYTKATEKIRNLKKAGQKNELAVLLNEISNDYEIASQNSAYLKSVSIINYTPKEKEVYKAVLDFAEASEHYILVLENIAYMAANNQDFPIMAETFLSIAIESQSKMDKARNLLQVLEGSN